MQMEVGVEHTVVLVLLEWIVDITISSRESSFRVILDSVNAPQALSSIFCLCFSSFLTLSYSLFFNDLFLLL
jgi:hypothetical protein